MRRDIDLIRYILLALATEKSPYDLDYTEQIISYHLWLLVNGGFVEATEVSEDKWVIDAFTWEGCELFELIADEKRWTAIKRVIDDMNCANIEIIKQIAVKQMKL